MEGDEGGTEMNELGEFFITFNTNGLQELKDGLKDINTKMDGLNTTFEKGVSKGDGFFSKFTAWGLKLSALAAGFIGVGKAINDAFKIGGEITKLNVVADVAGVKAESVEALAIALAPLKGGQKDYASAANFYRQMTETQTQWWRGQYSEKVIEEMSRAGVTGLKANSTQEQWMNGLIDALSYYQGQHTQQAIGARNLFAKAFGLTDEQMLLFAEGRDYVNQQLEYGRQHLTLSGEGNLRKAIEQTRAKMEFQESWEKLVINLIPLTTKIYEALKVITDVVSEYLPYIVKGIENFIEFLRPGWEILKSAISGIWDWFKKNILKEIAELPEKMNDQKANAAVNRINDGTASMRDISTVTEYMKEHGLYDEKVKARLDQVSKEIMDKNLIAAGKDPLFSNAGKALSYTNNGLNTRPGNVSNSSTNNTTANFGNIYVTGTENVGRVVRGQLNTAVNSMGSK